MTTRNNFTRLCAALAFLLAFLCQHTAIAQLTCNSSNQNTPSQLSPTNDCIATIDTDLLLDDGSDCDGTCDIIVREVPGGAIIAMGNTTIDVDLSDYLEMVIEIEVIDTDDGDFCFGYYLVQDKQNPTIDCPMDEIECTASIAPANITPVTFDDNCDDNMTPVQGVDMIDGPDCAFMPSQYIAKITRPWTVTDESGNSASCDQMIFILRPEADLSEVEFPADTMLDCSALADTMFTGRPTIDGNPIENNGFCEINIFTEDDTTSTCGGGYLIQRLWRVTNVCNSLIVDSIQIINLVDTMPPAISCLDTFRVDTEDSECFANVMLPQPTVSDDCSLYDVDASIPGEGTGFSYPGLAKGVYEVTYTATDDCDNDSTCVTILVVEDNETPTAVCEGTTKITLNSMGIAIVSAFSFDDGSNDNCPQALIYKASLEGGPFMDNLTFDCDDAGDTLMVTLQVTESLNPNSSNTCMNTAIIQDKGKPVLVCPPDMEVDCEEYMDDLVDLGTPFIFDPCGFELVIDSVETIDNCGTGDLKRTFTVTDPSGNVSSCMQTIDVINDTPFDGTGIIFPADYVATDGCTLPSDLEPVDLPAGFDEPVLPSDDCAMFAISYSDQLFYIDFPACYKIVRTWKVMDWCQYNPQNPTVGIWTDQQVIAVMDNTPPDVTFCPSDQTFGLNSDCSFADVVLTPVTAVGTCVNEDITITNNSAFATSNGADASGQYPEGVHVVTFTIVDGCGNEESCSVTITVEDLKAPTPYCKNGVITELAAMPGPPPVIMVTVEAWRLNLSSIDNCTDSTDLEFGLTFVGSGIPPAPELVFNCPDSIYEVELHVTDEAGNSDFCVTTIEIQDNMVTCQDDPLIVNAMIGGDVNTLMGDDLPDVHVDITSMSMSGMTDNTGSYEFHNLTTGNNYQVEPWKNDDPNNGVTTFDLVIMSRHILNIQPLSSPYKIIAADVNNNGAVTTMDIVELKKLILHMYDEFPNNNSWRFVPADYTFPNPANPFDPAFPEVANVMNLSADVYNANFVGVKIGDLNGSATVNFGATGAGDRSREAITLTTDDRNIEAGEELIIPFRSDQVTNLLALQFTLEFETDLELQGLEKGVLSGVAGDRFEISLLQQGIITGSWYDTAPVKVTADDALFSLRFRAKRAGRLSELIAVTSRFTEAVAYNDEETELNLNLAFTNPTNMQTSLAFQLFQNQPNPFKKVTNIGFTLPESGKVRLTIYDVAGNVLRTYSDVCSQGYNEVSIQRHELPTGGVLFYQLETDRHTATKKMILLQ